MPSHYRFRCCDCGVTEMRYRNARACRQCGSRNIMRLGTMRTKAEVGEALYNMLFLDEPETPEEIDAFLRAEGVDPVGVGARGRAFVEETIARMKEKNGY